jgi:heme-degrading monooxygenase HmoA
MHVLIVTFQLKDIGAEEFEASYADVVPVFAEMPGLLEKLWVKQPETSTFGGVYLWQDQATCTQYLNSDMFQQHIRNSPNTSNLVVQEYNVLEAPTQITHTLAAQGEAGARPPRPGQAEGDPDTVDATLKAKEARGDL